MIIRRRFNAVDLNDGYTGKSEVQDPPSQGLFGAIRQALAPQPRRPVFGAPAAAAPRRGCNCPGRRR